MELGHVDLGSMISKYLQQLNFLAGEPEVFTCPFPAKQ